MLRQLTVPYKLLRARYVIWIVVVWVNYFSIRSWEIT